MKYRKKPVIVEAYQIPSIGDVRARVCDCYPPMWLLQAIMEKKVVMKDEGGADIHTLEGVMHGNVGDYLIQGVKGELYACKPDIFEQTYEPLSNG